MKYVRQFLIIAAISFLGEVLNHFVPLPVPAGIYGIVILFILLRVGIVRLDMVKETGNFLVRIMPVMFIPAAVGVIDCFGIISAVWWKYALIIAITTAAVAGVSGLVTKFVQRLCERGKSRCD